MAASSALYSWCAYKLYPAVYVYEMSVNSCLDGSDVSSKRYLDDTMTVFEILQPALGCHILTSVLCVRSLVCTPKIGPLILSPAEPSFKNHLNTAFSRSRSFTILSDLRPISGVDYIYTITWLLLIFYSSLNGRFWHIIITEHFGLWCTLFNYLHHIHCLSNIIRISFSRL